MTTSAHVWRERLGSCRSDLEAPAVREINMQVRTGSSVPFERYMVGAGSADAPRIEAVNMQVRTGSSVPFASYMTGNSAAAPRVEAVNMQVRTGSSVPFANYMAGAVERPSVDTVGMQVRTGSSVPFNPYMLGAHGEELLRRRVMISPVVVVWQYRIANEEALRSWLSLKEILLSESRMSGDAEIKGVRYGGTYRVAGEAGDGVYKTVWGYTSEAAMHAMHRLCSDDSVSATLVQLELIDFVRGLKALIAEAGDQHFTQEVLVSASAGAAA